MKVNISSSLAHLINDLFPNRKTQNNFDVLLEATNNLNPFVFNLHDKVLDKGYSVFDEIIEGDQVKVNLIDLENYVNSTNNTLSFFIPARNRKVEICICDCLHTIFFLLSQKRFNVYIITKYATVANEVGFGGISGEDCNDLLDLIVVTHCSHTDIINPGSSKDHVGPITSYWLPTIFNNSDEIRRAYEVLTNIDYSSSTVLLSDYSVFCRQKSNLIVDVKDKFSLLFAAEKSQCQLFRDKDLNEIYRFLLERLELPDKEKVKDAVPNIITAHVKFHTVYGTIFE